MLADVDQFKQINDRYGHDAGDQVLKKVANLLKSRFRTTDYCMRIGGDEFALLLMDGQEGDTERIRSKVRYMNRILQEPDDGLPKASLSAGVAFSPHGYREALYTKADSALYQVKEQDRCGGAAVPFIRRTGTHRRNKMVPGDCIFIENVLE